MRYLKSYGKFTDVHYKLFESIEDLDYDLIEEIKEILLPFSDMDMKVSCDYTSDGDKISLNIMTTKEKSFDINDYKDDIDRLISYMKESGWDISKFNLAVVQDGEGRKNWTLGYRYSKNYDEPLQYDKVKTPTFWIMAEFVKIDNPIKESIDIDIIKDILLDLEDNQFTIEVNNKSKEWRYNSYTEIIIKRNVSGHNGGLMGFEFIWRDIKDTIFRLMDYYYTENESPQINSNKIVLSNREKMTIKDLYTNSPFRLFGHIRNGFAASDRMVEFGIGFTSEEDFNRAQDNSIGDYTIFEKIRILIKR